MLNKLWITLVVTAVTLVPSSGAAGAAPTRTMLDAALTCDAATRTVTATAAGNWNYPANTDLTVVFRTLFGSHASATASGPLPWRADVTVPVRTDATGAWSATSPTRPWAAAGDLFHQEKLQVIVRHATQEREFTRGDRTCTHDRRTTVTFACDAATGTLDVHAAGVDFGRHRSVDVRYYTIRSWYQATADSGMFVGQPLGSPEPFRRVVVPVAADGSWSDPGYQRSNTSRPYYAAEQYVVVVSTPGDFNTYVIGRGEGPCVTADQRPGGPTPR